MWVGAACSALSPKQSSNAMKMHKRFADEAVVVIKQKADENMVTCLRIKLLKVRWSVKMKGGTC